MQTSGFNFRKEIGSHIVLYYSQIMRGKREITKEDKSENHLIYKVIIEQFSISFVCVLFEEEKN